MPLFLGGHSMGCLVLNTYLGENPEIAKRLAGVIFMAPFFGAPDFVVMDAGKKAMVGILSTVLEEFVLNSGFPIHKGCRSKQFMRDQITRRKDNPLLSLGLYASFMRNWDKVAGLAKRTIYPYALIMGEKDVLVGNKASRAWHSKTASKIKTMRLMAGSYHELSKEPNNNVLFETSLQFMGERLVGKAPGTPA